MRGHEHDVPRWETEQSRGAEIDCPVRLVMPEQLGGQHAAPRQACRFGEIDEERHVAIRQRANHDPRLQTAQTAYRIRPGYEPVPRPGEIRGLARRKLES